MAWIDSEDTFNAWLRFFHRSIACEEIDADSILSAQIVYADALDAEYTDDDDYLRCFDF